MISTILALGFATVAAATNAVEVLPMYTTAAAAEATGAMMAQQAYGSGGGEVVQPTSTSADIYSAMPYQTMQAGGYKQLQCGYGWAKDSNGKCVQQSWVSRRFSMPGLGHDPFSCLQYQMQGCYGQVIINKCVPGL